jgi:hypothetical protein
MHEFFFFSIAILAIAIIFCIWKRYLQFMWKLQQKVRKRVTFLLWKIATGKNPKKKEVDSCAPI